MYKGRLLHRLITSSIRTKALFTHVGLQWFSRASLLAFFQRNLSWAVLRSYEDREFMPINECINERVLTWPVLPWLPTKQHDLRRVRGRVSLLSARPVTISRQIHYSNVILLHFSILSICHCSWVVTEDQRTVWIALVYEWPIYNPPPPPSPPPPILVPFQFIKPRLHKRHSRWTRPAPTQQQAKSLRLTQ